MPSLRLERVEHEWTIEWVIEMSLRIHGGDPAPDEINRASANILVNLAVHNIARKLPAGQSGGDPVLLDELRLMKETARLGSAEVVADLVDTYCRESRR